MATTQSSFLVAVTLLLPLSAFAQIGGATAAEGVFVLDDAEDLDLNAGGVGRNWIPDYTNSTPVLTAVDPTTTGLVLINQTPSGLLRFQANPVANYINKSFGVPMPSEKGASTLSYPGNIAEFESLTFAAVQSDAAPGQRLSVLLECYPRNTDGSYPQLVWNFTPPQGNVFGVVRMNLHEPDHITNPGAATVEEMLARTRYLAFYAYAAKVQRSAEVVVYFDDISLRPPVDLRRAAWVIF